MVIINGKQYESTQDYIESLKKSFRKKYKKNVSVCEKLAKEHKGIYGATLWTGCDGLPSFFSFDLNEVLDYLISHTNWNEHPDLARVEFIKFGVFPDQQTVGYLFSDYDVDGYLDVRYGLA